MNVVVEGPDGGGKSTLCAVLAKELGMRVQVGDGPPKTPGEIERRLRRYIEMDDVIFDRHPAISQPIYGKLRGEPPSVEFLDMVGEFYTFPAVFVYCRSTTVDHHVVKAGEDPSHVATLTARYLDLVCEYDRWACDRANLIYRFQQDSPLVVDAIRTAVG